MINDNKINVIIIIATPGLAEKEAQERMTSIMYEEAKNIFINKYTQAEIDE